MIDYDLFTRYEKALGANASMFSRAVRDLADEVEGMDEASMRAHLRERYPALARAYGTVAAEAAREFYEAQRAMANVASEYGEYEAEASYPDDLDAELAVQANSVPVGSVYAFLNSRGVHQVMRCADSTLDLNAARDPAHPKWALVPHPGACAWCVMLGSRGFAYQSEMTVGSSRHDDCKCTPVVDFDTANPKLRDYDPKALLEEYKKREDSGETRFRQRKRTGRRRYKKQRKTVGAQASYAQAAKLVEYLEGAESASDFQQRALKADAQWQASKHEGHAFQNTLKPRYVELARKWGLDPKKRPETD